MAALVMPRANAALKRRSSTSSHRSSIRPTINALLTRRSSPAVPKSAGAPVCRCAEVGTAAWRILILIHLHRDSLRIVGEPNPEHAFPFHWAGDGFGFNANRFKFAGWYFYLSTAFNFDPYISGFSAVVYGKHIGRLRSQIERTGVEESSDNIADTSGDVVLGVLLFAGL